MTGYKGIVYGLPEHDYHSHAALSSTEARMILNDTPAKYRWKKDHPPLIEPSKKFDIGSAVHSLVLGTGYEAVVIPADLLATNGAISTTAAKAFVADARDKGLIPLKLEEFQPIADAAESVLAHPAAKQLFGQPADGEVSVFATSPEGVDVRARFDFLPTEFRLGEPSRVAVDLKTARDASPRGFTKSIAEYGYDVQRAWYLDALRWVTGESAEMVFVAVEKEPPYLVAVHQLPTVWVEMGSEKAKRAREVFARCVESGVWPGYGDDVHLLSPPQWLIYKHEEEYGDE
jgi:hypothetical protein